VGSSAKLGLSAKLGSSAKLSASAKLILAISVAVVLEAGLCPALCVARSAETASPQLEYAGMPDKVPCHGTREAPSRGESRDDCDRDCSRFDSVALVAPGTCTVVDSLAAVHAVTFFTPLPPVNAIPAGEFGPAPVPPPRNLLLVKNSFLI